MLRATLFIGSVSEQVTVEAATVRVQTDAAELSSVVGGAIVGGVPQRLATNGRSIYTVANVE